MTRLSFVSSSILDALLNSALSSLPGLRSRQNLVLSLALDGVLFWVVPFALHLLNWNVVR